MATIESNLPADSQPWGREVDKRLDSLETAISNNEINDLARDKQLRSSLNKVAELTNLNNEAIDYLNDQATYVAVKPHNNDGVSLPGTGEVLVTIDHTVPGFKFIITIDKPKIMTLRHTIGCHIGFSNKGAGFYYGAIQSGFKLNGNIIDSSDPLSNGTISFYKTEQFTSTVSSTYSASSGTLVNEFALVLPAGTHAVEAMTTFEYNLPGTAADTIFYTIQKEVFSATVNSNSVIIPDASTIINSGASNETGGGAGGIYIAGL